MFHDNDTDVIKRKKWDSLPGCCSPVSEQSKDQIPNVRLTEQCVYTPAFQHAELCAGDWLGEKGLRPRVGLLVLWLPRPPAPGHERRKSPEAKTF